ncbi:hypothetical protein LJC74_03380 [Eubacteriales bacterium OttesenSCG-928-A19]|nr:hypothetical protein [Eubacteriales bacterium OttesenSCG-928-A19]
MTYSDEAREHAIKIYYSGVSGRGVGKIFGMGKENVVRWIKKTKTLSSEPDQAELVEMDELYWFIDKKPGTKTRENMYIITMVSRNPRQIMDWEVAFDKTASTIQRMVDRAPPAVLYCTDGYVGYLDVVYPGRHIRNMCDKSDIFTVEGINADLRHYIPGLARRRRCFYRKRETLDAVMSLFIHAYNSSMLTIGLVRLNNIIPNSHSLSSISFDTHWDTPEGNNSLISEMKYAKIQFIRCLLCYLYAKYQGLKLQNKNIK